MTDAFQKGAGGCKISRNKHLLCQPGTCSANCWRIGLFMVRRICWSLISVEQSVLQKLHLPETRRSWQAGLMDCFCFASFIFTNSKWLPNYFHKWSTGCIKLGKGWKNCGFCLVLYSVMLLQIFCIYAAIHTCMDLDCWIIGGVWLHPEAWTVQMFLKWCLQVSRWKHKCKWRGLCEVRLEWQSPQAVQGSDSAQVSFLVSI